MYLHPKFVEPPVSVSTENDIIVNQTSPYWKLLLVDNYLYFRNRAANFVEICNIYDN